MEVKKKLSIFYQILLFGFFFIVLNIIMSGNSYAITEEQFANFIDESYTFFDENVPNTSQYYNQFENVKTMYNEIIYSQNATGGTEYDFFLIFYSSFNNRFKIKCWKSGTVKVYMPNDLNTFSYYYLEPTYYKEVYITKTNVSQTSEYYDTNNGNISGESANYIPYKYYTSNGVIYNGDTDVPMVSDQLLTIIEPTSTIRLESSSNHKFGFNDFNQCRVYLTGDYDIMDFTFWVEKQNGNVWEVVTNTLDYRKLLDYEDPYYVFWTNLNYMPVGTYRYKALLNESIDTYFYSEPFQITQSVIDNPATGTVDNGNIDINIDTGNTVDSIKDFLGQDTDVTEDQFADNFPSVEVDDPTSDFFTWFFDQIQSCFTVSTAQYLTFTLYDNEFRINSDDYILNIPILKSVIGVGSSIFIFYGIFLDIRKEIEKVKEGKFSEIGKDDITASMM